MSNQVFTLISITCAIVWTTSFAVSVRHRKHYNFFTFLAMVNGSMWMAALILLYKKHL